VENSDPISLFSEWLGEAERIPGLKHPNAMQLATATAAGQPSVRTVLLKGFSPNGFVFYTNYESQNGRELTENPQASLCFYWDHIERQVRVGGSISRLGRVESEVYFASRPRSSQIGAWASRQGQEIPTREYLEERVREFEEKFSGQPIPLPPYWGGFLLNPNKFEFWQGMAHRLHHRAAFERTETGWRQKILSP